MRLADLQLSERERTVLATVTGEIDMSNAAELQAALTDGTPNSVRGLVLDLSSVDYLDSAGIHLLLRLHSSLHTRQQTLVLVVPADSVVSDTFRLAGLSAHLPRCETQDEALSLLRSRSASAAG